jgi:DNA-binding HxlR family transcriptional regulator
VKLPFNKALFNTTRLMIAEHLNDEETPIPFRELKQLLELTDGNLASHLRMMEKKRLISVKKEFNNRKPCTSYSLTPKGKLDLKLLKNWFFNHFIEGGE